MMKIIKENLLIYKIKINTPFIIMGENYSYKKLSQILNGEEGLIKKIIYILVLLIKLSSNN